MLQGIAQFSMRGRWQAAGVIALLSVAALMLPPFSYLASGVIALCTLRMGPKEGIKVVLATTVIFSLIAGLLLNNFYLSGLFLISSWLPILGASWILGYTRSLAMSLLATTALSIVVVLGFYLVIPDPSLWWQQVIAPFAESLTQQPNWQFDQTQTQAIVLNLSSMMTGLMAAGLSLNIMLGLLIGRSWQAKLYNPGGFADEFQQLRLGKSIAILTLIMMVVTALPLGDGMSILRACLPVLLVVFTLQGLSVVHAIVRQQKRQSFWLVAVYVLLLVMMPQMAVLLTIIGVLEQWFNFRRLNIVSDE
ncbi:hypothetical protein LCGC14_0554060 [marine sediment metagenome]|uniref:DUF2232 domain-containing protein n=1 Tax=marine sediment metagenome TaxID=412755 RepID=A0A0F9RP34_9ZZZZ|nr:DUF2232 domain-containing protein [Methylophaga sp.]